MMAAEDIQCASNSDKPKPEEIWQGGLRRGQRSHDCVLAPRMVLAPQPPELRQIPLRRRGAHSQAEHRDE